MKIAHLNKYWCVWVHVSSIAQHSLTGLIVPFQLGDKVLDDLHENHPEIAYMKALARSCVWCPGMEKRIKEKVHHFCQVHQNMPAAALIYLWENVTSPCVRVHFELWYHLCSLLYENQYNWYKNYCFIIVLLRVLNEVCGNYVWILKWVNLCWTE